MRAQVTELCTNYGKIYGFWWDAIRLREDIDQDPGLNQLIRKLQPGVVINNRGFDEDDFSTPERDYDKDDQIAFDRPVEACQAVGMESWGYRKNEDYYTDRHLIRSIDKYLSRDASYLLNVGTDPLRVIPEQDRRILKNIGRWYKTVKESFELEFAPQDHVAQKSYLRLINLPTNEMCNTVLVIRLEFDRPPEEILQGTVAPEVIKDVQK